MSERLASVICKESNAGGAPLGSQECALLLAGGRLAWPGPPLSGQRAGTTEYRGVARSRRAVVQGGSEVPAQPGWPPLWIPPARFRAGQFIQRDHQVVLWAAVITTATYSIVKAPPTASIAAPMPASSSFNASGGN
jgi:hypothetical protein